MIYLIYDASTGEPSHTVGTMTAGDHFGPGQAQVEIDPGTDIRRAWVDVATGEISISDTPRVPPPPDPDEELAAERQTMRAYRLAFEDACRATAYGEGTLLDAIDGILASVPSIQTRRYNNITIFERLKPEVAAFLQSPEAINLMDEQVDDLFRLAMQIERAAP